MIAVHAFASHVLMSVSVDETLLTCYKTDQSVCIAKFHRCLCVSFSRVDSKLCMCQLFGWSNLNLHNSRWITFPNQSCLVLVSFWSYLLHSLIIIIIICSLLRVFHTSVTWWFLIGVWVTTSLLKPPGLFSVFWPISLMQ